jgi:DNA polymerase I-like protein with 3'-5' exonuclease and polymerase domains
LSVGPHPAALRAKELLAIKTAAKEVELYNKLLLAGKFHASFRVIGTLSSRMSGGDGLNPQGIRHSKEVRKQFPLAWNGYTLSGGDFDSFEITLADAVYNDPDLREALVSGKKIHGLFGMELFPGQTYEQILASDGSSDLDMYTVAKSCVFASLFGGTAETFHLRQGISLEIAKRAYESWGRRFPGIAKARIRVYNAFCSMRQPNGIGSAVDWTDPAEYVESFLGDRRYFTLENRICKELFNLARNVPKEWKDSAIKVVRRDRVQTGAGAVSSALYGAAFSLQQTNMRAAANHEIQSPGARITKYVQRKIWDVQPSGIHEFCVAPANIHDEILCVTHPDYVEQVAEVVRESVEHFRPQVPLIAMKWNLEMENWSEKKQGGRAIHIKAS